ncbi:MAG: hypothetical protein GY832_00805 [Chloroflexi bacterium]|nr:hypothetical protein [Chloroflexota bacterium]
MKIVMPHVPEEFAITIDDKDKSPNTIFSLQMSLVTRAMYNPVPTLAVALEFLSETGLTISDEVYDEVMDNLTTFITSPIWETIIETSFQQRGDRFTNTAKIYAAHRTFIIKLVHNMRTKGHDIPVQSWEPQTEPLETKEKS